MKRQNKCKKYDDKDKDILAEHASSQNYIITKGIA